MNFITKIRQRLLIKKNRFIEADAIVLSINSQHKMLIQVLPVKERNFVVEILNLSISSTIRSGQRVRVKYDPAHHCRIEITEVTV